MPFLFRSFVLWSAEQSRKRPKNLQAVCRFVLFLYFFISENTRCHFVVFTVLHISSYGWGGLSDSNCNIFHCISNLNAFIVSGSSLVFCSVSQLLPRSVNYGSHSESCRVKRSSSAVNYICWTHIRIWCFSFARSRIFTTSCAEIHPVVPANRDY